MGKVMDALFGPRADLPQQTDVRAEATAGDAFRSNTDSMQTRAEPVDPDMYPDAPNILPPPRAGKPREVLHREAMGISMVYRAIAIHLIAAKQMGIGEWREILTPPYGETRVPVSGLIRKPDPNEKRSAFIEKTVSSMACTGNAFWLKLYDPVTNNLIGVRLLDPLYVRISASVDDVPTEYTYKDKTYKAFRIEHLKLMRVPGSMYGLGPIQAAQIELRGALDLNDYAGNWFHDSPVPTGILSTDTPLSADAARQNKDRFKESMGGKRDIAMLGNGLKYQHIFLSPRDVQFIESQQFTTTQVARMFGSPASLMLAAVEGNSQTYANIEQDWLGFVRFSHMQYLIEIEDAFTELLPNGRYVKFNIDAFLRTDTTTRYAAHAVALDPVKGWMKKNEIRKIENLDPLPEFDTEEVATNE